MPLRDRLRSFGNWLNGNEDVALAARPASTAVAVRQPVAVAVPVDEMGRDLLPFGRPVTERMFLPRALDRRPRIRPPWSAQQIINALAAAENGDMGPQADLFEAMDDRDAAYLAFKQTRIGAPSKLPWSIEPADDSDLAKQIADFVRAEIKTIPNFQQAHRDVFSAIGSGISALWIDWQEGGRSHGGAKPLSQYRIDGLHFINPKRYRFHWMLEKFLILPDWAFGKATDLGLMSGYAGPVHFDQFISSGLGIEPPPWKVLIHRTRTKSGHPAKAGVARVCALHFYLRINVLNDAAVYCEVYGMPFRIAKYPPGMSDPEKVELQVAMDKLGSDASAIISNLVDFQFLEARNRTGGTMPYFELLKECERQVQLAWLGQDQTSTHNDAGGRTQVEFGGAPIRQDLIEADCIDAQTTYTMQLCYPIVGFSNFEKPETSTDVNGQTVTKWPIADALCPKFKIKYEPEEDRKANAEIAKMIFIDLKLPVTPTLLSKFVKVDLPPQDVLNKAGIKPDEVIDYSAVKEIIPPGPTAERTAPGSAPAPRPAPKPPTKPMTNHTTIDGYRATLMALPEPLRSTYIDFATEASNDEPYDFASVQVNVTGDIAAQCLDLAASIPDDALAEKGREDVHHVTAKFGIDPSVTIDELRAAIGSRVSGSLTFGPTAFFALPDYDVVFLTVDSPDLVALNRAIVDGVKTTDTQPNYVPHLTLAYVESGRGHEFAGNGSMNGVKYDYTSVYYSDVDGNLTKIQAIRGHVRVTPPKMEEAMESGQTIYLRSVDRRGVHSQPLIVPDGWPEGTDGIGFHRSTYETLGRLLEKGNYSAAERVGIEGEREQIRAECWLQHLASAPARTRRTASAGQAAIDDLTSRAEERAKAAFASLSQEVRDVIAKAEAEGKTLADLPAILRSSFADLDASKLARLIARTTFVARLHGMSSAKRTPPPAT